MPACTSSSQQATRTSSFQSQVRKSNRLDSLKQIDIEFMRRLHTKVNLIPVIAKADTLTDEEVTEFKARVSKCSYFPVSACIQHHWTQDTV
jgi:stage III sporulation protein SpoIIIAA